MVVKQPQSTRVKEPTLLCNQMDFVRSEQIAYTLNSGGRLHFGGSDEMEFHDLRVGCFHGPARLRSL